MNKLETIFEFLNTPTDIPRKERSKSERNQIITAFVDALNADREGKTIKTKKGIDMELKPLKTGFIVSKMADSGMKRTEELKEFLEDCQKAKNFSAFWWWSLDGKNARKR